MSEHQDIGDILEWDSKDGYGDPVHGFSLVLGDGRWLGYTESATRTLHRTLTAMISKWDMAN